MTEKKPSFWFYVAGIISVALAVILFFSRLARTSDNITLEILLLVFGLQLLSDWPAFGIIKEQSPSTLNKSTAIWHLMGGVFFTLMAILGFFAADRTVVNFAILLVAFLCGILNFFWASKYWKRNIV
ncbi:MAG: hypothetical protein Q7K98_06870 [Candidatus Omnitrophota bacterium]|nr:hypothetical protein [Candidatus Omnitrophota bacterium]